MGARRAREDLMTAAVLKLEDGRLSSLKAEEGAMSQEMQSGFRNKIGYATNFSQTTQRKQFW